MKRFLPYYRHLRPVKWYFIIGVACGIIFAAATGAGMPLMVKMVFPVLFHEKSEVTNSYQIWITHLLGAISADRLLLITCLWIPCVFLVRGISSYANSYLINLTGLRVLEAIRVDMFVKLQGLPLSFFKKNRSGDLLARLTNDTEILRQVLVQSSDDMVKQPATLIFAIGVLVYNSIHNHSFFVAIIALISLPACVAVIRLAGKRLAVRAQALQKQGGDLTATLTETLQSPLEIRAYNLQARQIAQFRYSIREMLKLNLKVVKYRQFISPSIEVVAAVCIAIALFFGVRAGLTLPEFLTLATALYMSYDPIKKLGNIHSLFQQGAASLDRMEFVLHQPDSLPDPSAPLPFRNPQHSIRFDNVSFAYEEEPVLQQINVEIAMGQVVALVGPSGAGKTTLANLIPRFYDPQSGSITIDGTDVRKFGKNDLRSHIAVMPQMPALFIGTIMENIRIGRLDATEAEVIEAARKAHADDFIRNTLADGYQTQVGERGDQLSGGQRQRIAIARAFLRNAPILILDEATSALDSESESMVQQALTELVKGRTTFIIAHRFSTISIADRILVFENGRIVADGTHEQLGKSSLIYQSMAGNQPDTSPGKTD